MQIKVHYTVEPNFL